MEIAADARNRKRAPAHPVASALLAIGALVVSACAASSPSGLGEFRRSLNTTEHGYRVIEDPTGAAQARMVERFEVRPGDCGIEAGYNDCQNDRERSELAQVPGGRIPVGTEAWYGWDLYMPANFPNVFPTKTVLGQFHQTGSHPLFMFLHTGDGLVLDNQIDRSAQDLLIPEAQLRGRWHRVMVFARWRKDATGLLRVFVDGDLKSEYRGATVTAHEVYLKYGVYRAFISRFKTARNTDAVPAQIAYFANVASAPTREDLFTAHTR